MERAPVGTEMHSSCLKRRLKRWREVASGWALHVALIIGSQSVFLEVCPSLL